MFFAACEGYFDKLEDQERIVRKQTHILLMPHIKQQNSDVKAFWGELFTESINREKIVPLTQEEVREMAARHNLIFQNQHKWQS